ncbi:MAG TPA: metabolite traffic protein EboE [Burkholderiales bacterium]|nr:metabolite traffic protein EboE [Burkholderiales bacterium]
MHLAASAAGRDLGHLTYCTNIHAGEALQEVQAGLARYLPEIKAGVSPGRPFGVGLRLGHAAAEGLRDRAALEALKRFLAEGGYYVFTLNAFPYGAFHGRAVKEDAYRPDWSEPERLAYTDHAADLLSELLPAGAEGSVSTVPCTFKPWAAGRMEAIVEHLIRHVAHLVALRGRTGQTIALALEPEPYCYLETIEETVAFFEAHLFHRAGVARLAALTGLGPGAAEAAMRRHIGVCYDVCHAAVEFEDARASVARLRAAGIAIGKLQLSSALRVAALDAQSAQHLAAFAEPVYLHQAVERSGGRLRRYLDLPEALGAAARGAELRVHFHVPVFLEQMQNFGTTQAFLAEILALHRAEPISRHLEVETYTWDVLPASYRGAGLGPAIARELNWVKAQLLQ